VSTATKKKPAKAARCKCVDLCNEALASQNAELVTELVINFKTGDARLEMTIPLRKVDPAKKGKLPTLMPTYCPICGKNLEHKTKAKKETP